MKNESSNRLTDKSWQTAKEMQNVEELAKFREEKIREILESVKFLVQNFGNEPKIIFREWQKFYDLQDKIRGLRLQLKNQNLSKDEKEHLFSNLQNSQSRLKHFLLPSSIIYHDFWTHVFLGNTINVNSDSYVNLVLNLSSQNEFIQNSQKLMLKLLLKDDKNLYLSRTRLIFLEMIHLLPHQSQKKIKKIISEIKKNSSNLEDERKLEAEILVKIQENNLENELNLLHINLKQQNTFRGILAFAMEDYYKFLINGIIKSSSLLNPIILQNKENQMRIKIGQINQCFQQKPENFENYQIYYQNQGIETTNDAIDIKIYDMNKEIYQLLQKFLENKQV